MKLPNNRDDLSRFLVHLTRDYDGESAEANLINIIKKKTIEARNAHCLVMHRIRNFTPVLKKKFKTVCFTEAPLTQLNRVVNEIKGRKIILQPFGLIFWKENLFELGASPAIYINAKGTSISQFLLNEFDSIFKNVKTFKKFKEQEKKHYTNIVQYYSLINVVNDKHDFMWEREWRHHGDFKFKYNDIVAIVAKDPDIFENWLEKNLTDRQYKFIKRLPIINPEWTYEELVEELAISIWDKLC
jgi:hypothetical protein